MDAGSELVWTVQSLCTPLCLALPHALRSQRYFHFSWLPWIGPLVLLHSVFPWVFLRWRAVSLLWVSWTLQGCLSVQWSGSQAPSDLLSKQGAVSLQPHSELLKWFLQFFFSYQLNTDALEPTPTCPYPTAHGLQAFCHSGLSTLHKNLENWAFSFSINYTLRFGEDTAPSLPLLSHRRNRRIMQLYLCGETHRRPLWTTICLLDMLTVFLPFSSVTPVGHR